MNTLDCIRSRESVRSYSGDKIPREKIETILNAAISAPSGKNGQPWRFFVVQKNKNLFRRIAEQTVYFPSVVYADCLILVFLDKAESYHYIKDVQAVGACIENMLLAAHDLNIGACWNGEILKNDRKICELLSLGKRYDLMAMIVLGFESGNDRKSGRKALKEVLLGDE